MIPGSYALILEYIDTNSSLPDIVLKTETIPIDVPADMSIYGVPASPTTYDRNVALKDSILLAAGSSRTLSVEHVHSYYSETCGGISINHVWSFFESKMLKFALLTLFGKQHRVDVSSE